MSRYTRQKFESTGKLNTLMYVFVYRREPTYALNGLSGQRPSWTSCSSRAWSSSKWTTTWTCCWAKWSPRTPRSRRWVVTCAQQDAKAFCLVKRMIVIPKNPCFRPALGCSPVCPQLFMWTGGIIQGPCVCSSSTYEKPFVYNRSYVS